MLMKGKIIVLSHICHSCFMLKMFRLCQKKGMVLVMPTIPHEINLSVTVKFDRCRPSG